MMENQDNDSQLKKHPLEILHRKELLELECYDKPSALKDHNHFEQLKLTDEQKMYVSGLVKSIPSAVATIEMAQAYTVKFPKDLPQVLTELGQGGVGSMIIGPDGKIAGHASFYTMFPQATIFGVFTAMSAVTGQYFLKQINAKMDTMNLEL